MATFRTTPSGKTRAQVYLGKDPVTGKDQFRSKTLATKTLAKVWATEAEAQRNDGTAASKTQADVADGRLTVGDYWTGTVLPYRRAGDRYAPATVKRNVSHWANHLAPTFAGRPLGAVRRAEVNAWSTERLEAGAGVPTVEAALNLLSAIYTHAMDNDLVDYNPAVGVKTPKHEPADKGYLSRETVAAILGHVPEPYRLFLELTVETGMRFGEAAGIKREAVLAEGRQVRVRTVLTRSGVKDLPKNSTSQRVVPVPTHLRARLAERTMATPAGCLVFTGAMGGGLSDSNLRGRVLAKACDATGTPRIGLHHLRHAYASWLTEAGVSAFDVAEALGHSSTRMLDRYSHLAPGHGARILEGLEASRNGRTMTGERTASQGYGGPSLPSQQPA